MTSKSFIVIGEAPESDSEEEIDSSQKSKDNLSRCKGKIIGGEAPESDEESYADSGSLESISSALSASSIPSLTGEKKTYPKKNSSLLVKKLRERNASLKKNMKEFVSQTVSIAGNELNNTNQLLLKCQVQLQEASEILKTIKLSMCTLDSHLQSILTMPFVPFIAINEMPKETSLKVS